MYKTLTPPTPISRSPSPPLLTGACGWVFVSVSGIYQSLKTILQFTFIAPSWNSVLISTASLIPNCLPCSLLPVTQQMTQNSDLPELATCLTFAHPGLGHVPSSCPVFPLLLQITCPGPIMSQEATPPGYWPIFIRQKLNHSHSMCWSFRKKCSCLLRLCQQPKKNFFYCLCVFSLLCSWLRHGIQYVDSFPTFVRRNKDQERIGSISSWCWNYDT